MLSSLLRSSLRFGSLQVRGFLLARRGSLLLGPLLLLTSLLPRELALLAFLLLGVLTLLAGLPLGLALRLSGLLALTARRSLGFVAFLTTGSLGLGLELVTTGPWLGRGNVLDRVDDVEITGIRSGCGCLRCFIALEIGDDRTGSQDLTCGGRPFF